MIIETLRDYEQHPSGLGKWKFTFQNDKDTGEAEHVFPREPKPGYALVFKWTTARSGELELVKTGDVADETAVIGDGLDAKSDADIQDLMAQKGLKYNPKKFDRFAGIVALREKIAEPRKALAGAGV